MLASTAKSSDISELSKAAVERSLFFGFLKTRSLLGQETRSLLGQETRSLPGQETRSLLGQETRKLPSFSTTHDNRRK